MLVPDPLSVSSERRGFATTLVLVLACLLGFGWVVAQQTESRPQVDAALGRLEAAIRASPDARLSPTELAGLPDLWRAELESVTDASGPMDPAMSQAVAELRERVHELPTWRLGWIPSMQTPYGWLTYIFVHTQWFHLAVNVLLLWLLGATLEGRSSPRLLATSFLLSGASGAWGHAGLFSASTVPLVGASAAVAGVLGALLVAAPSRILPFVLVGSERGGRPAARLKVPLAAILLIWIALEWLVFLEAGTAPSALPAHLFGLVCGALTAWIWRRFAPSTAQGSKSDTSI